MTLPQRKILVVDDEPEIRAVVRGVLETGGYLVVDTGDPVDALDLARKEAPDLVLCDLVMPRVDGYGVLRALQADAITSRVPVVFLTARRDFSERVRAFRFGVVDYITKPFTRDILLKKVERILAGLRERSGLLSEGPAEEVIEEVRVTGRSGVLTLRDGTTETTALVQGGTVVEGHLPAMPQTAAVASFRELDLDREDVVSAGPTRLPGDHAEAPSLENLPAMLRSALVVDDSEQFRAYLREVLSRRGFDVLEAADGDEGLRVALQKRPWLILTDVAMPRMNGIDFCRAVRRHALIRHTPLVFLSGWDDFKERYAGMEAGGDDFVSKETPVRELLLRVQVLLNRYAALGRRDPEAVLEGRLELTGPSALLQMCHLSDLSGSLSVQASGRCIEVRMSRGQMVSATEILGGRPRVLGAGGGLRSPVVDHRPLLLPPRRSRRRAHGSVYGRAARRVSSTGREGKSLPGTGRLKSGLRPARNRAAPWAANSGGSGLEARRDIGQCIEQIGCLRITTRRVLLEAARDDGPEALGELGVDGGRRRRNFLDLLEQDIHHRFALERESPGEDFVEHHTEGVDVRAEVGRLALGLLGGHVGGSAEDDARGGDLGILHLRDSGDAEVHDLHVARLGQDEHVLRFDVAVDHTFGVRSFESQAHLFGDA